MRRFLSLLFLVLFFGTMSPVKADDALLQQLIPVSKPQFLPVQQAFVLSTQQTGNQLQIRLQPAEGYYLYKDKIRIDVAGADFTPLSLPSGEIHQDEFLGQTEIYSQMVTFAVSFKQIPPGTTAVIHYQGCTPGLCYPPQQKNISLQAYSPPATPTIPFSHNGFSLQPGWLTLLSFFAMGIGLSLTPCVYPMYPVQSAMLTQQGHLLNWRRGFILSLAYVVGMALTYSLIGIAIASAGAGIQGWLQNPWVLGIMSVFYLCLALSLLWGQGLQLPRSWQDKLQYLANRQSLHSLHGVAFLGALSGLIGSPCTSAPLSGVLLFIAQSGQPFYGALTLFLLSLGMGVPLLVIGLFGGKLLPKAGAWMVFVKQLFAILLLAMPLFLLERLLPEHIATLLWSGFSLAVLLWLCWRLWPNSVSPRFKPLILVSLLVAGGFAIAQLAWQKTDTLAFTPITNTSELHQQLSVAKAQGKPVMLDLYANWCTACRELDAKTFSNPKIRESLRDYQLLRADVSANSGEDQALLQHLKVLGLPNVLFFDKQSTPNPQLHIEGFVSADELQHKLDQCQRSQLC